MENILKKNLCEMVKGKISENDLPKALEALEHFICLASINSKLQEKDLLQLLTGNIEEQKMSIGTWGNIETILKTLCKIVDPNQYQLYHEDHVKTEELYKDIFQLVPTVRANGGYFALTYVNPKTAKMENPNYPHIEAFVTLYKFRNDSVHMTEEISAFEINRLLPYIANRFCIYV